MVAAGLEAAVSGPAAREWGTFVGGVVLGGAIAAGAAYVALKYSDGGLRGRREWGNGEDGDPRRGTPTHSRRRLAR